MCYGGADAGARGVAGTRTAERARLLAQLPEGEITLCSAQSRPFTQNTTHHPQINNEHQPAPTRTGSGYAPPRNAPCPTKERGETLTPFKEAAHFTKSVHCCVLVTLMLFISTTMLTHLSHSAITNSARVLVEILISSDSAECCNLPSGT